MKENEAATAVIGAAIEVHRSLGPGLLESAYGQCLRHELALRGISHEYEVPLPVHYKGQRLKDAYRIDLLVERRVVVELKAIEQILPLHKAQLLTYLRLADCRLGLLLNFNVKLMRNGIVRVANGVID